MKSFVPIFFASIAIVTAQEKPDIPEELLDSEAIHDPSTINEYTAPSIAKIFEELEKIAPLTYQAPIAADHERLPIDPSRLALRLGTLIATGIIAVQTGSSDDIPEIASHLSRYAQALGAGERIKKHAASLLEHAKARDLDKLKLALAATQRDVENELAGLRNPDLSHLISLGGWLQALDSASQAVDKKYTPERAVILFREDVADYYAESIGALHEDLSTRPHIMRLRQLMHGLRTAMVLEDEETPPTAEQVTEVAKVAAELVAIARN